MNSPPLYDLSPLVTVMLVGAVLALGPLLWVIWRNRGGSPQAHLHRLTALTLFLTFDLVLFGAFTRLSDSGLGCPDWPGCYGNASPLGAQADIAQAQQALPTGPVTHGKAWVEMTHRYMATGVGALILVIAALSWRLPRHNQGQGHRPSPWWATASLVWVCIQGAFGALTVTMKLFPAIVTLHLMGALVLLALLCVQVVQLRPAPTPTRSAVRTASPAVSALLWFTVAALVLQVMLGGWVSTNYAVLACNDFPRCQGSWWPDMNFEQGFQIWRRLGLTAQGEHITFAALTAIHYLHRLMAGVVLALLGLLAWVLNRDPATRRPSRWLALLIGLQLATGLSNVVLGWPLLAALLHTGGAAALVVVLTWVACLHRLDRGTQTLTVRGLPA
jgi:heme a synthase